MHHLYLFLIYIYKFMPHNLKIRDVTYEDVKSLLKNKYDFPIPDISSCQIKATVEDDNYNLVGIGMIKVVGEITIIIDPTKSNIEKSKAIKLLFDEALYKSIKNDIHQWYVFVDDNKWALTICKHYNFEPVNRNCYTLEI